jgi:hypothetical protein
VTVDATRLYELMPAVYRVRDAAEQQTLEDLVAVLGEQAAVLEETIRQLYDDQFIETCAEWVVPYIGDLIGARGVHTLGTTKLSQRAQVANTIAYRRRKGTLAVAEQLARDVTAWEAHAVEFFQHLTATQHVNHVRPENLQSPDLRLWEPLELLHTPFDPVTHTVEVRRIEPGRGKYNIPNVGIFLWRVRANPLSDSPAFRVVDGDGRRYRFSPLGQDLPLFNRPEPEDEITHMSERINVPMPISRRTLDAYLDGYYGPSDKSISLEVDGNDIDVSEVVVCNLSDVPGGAWGHSPADRFAIDPVLGRLATPANRAEPQSIRVTFHYGFSAFMGGGEYDRAATIDPLRTPVRRVPTQDATIEDALAALDGDGAVEIENSGRYVQPAGFSISVPAGDSLEIRAGDRHRPTIVLEGDVIISGGDEAELTLNGLLITGAHLNVTGISRLVLRHCTLVPGIALSPDGEPLHAADPSLVVGSPDLTVTIDHCILGGVRAVDGSTVRINDSIVDAMAPNGLAFAAPDASTGGALAITNSTVVGRVSAALLEFASNTIFRAEAPAGVAPVSAHRRQQGCVRFCYVPPGSQVPRRYRCTTVLPQFTSLRYGDPGYAQLSRLCPSDITEGADDEAELGAFHDLHQRQREANLRTRLDEYLRFGLEAGVFYAS